MSKFDWMELETLSNEIAHAQSRLDAARATKNLGLVQLLEREIADAAKRRAQTLVEITNRLSAGRFVGPKPGLERVPVNQPQTEAKTPQANEQLASRTAPAAAVGSGEAGSGADITTRGAVTMWDKLTAADFERIKRGLATRRSEILARHAEELKALEAEQSEIDTIEQAIAAFAQKFKLTASAEVLPFDGERVPSQAG
jgi:hypothetical protein